MQRFDNDNLPRFGTWGRRFQAAGTGGCSIGICGGSSGAGRPHVGPFFTPDLFFPYRASLYFHTLNLLPSVLAIPVVLIAGLPTVYNSLFLSTFVLSGYGMYRLALYVLRRQAMVDTHLTDQARLAAFVGGVTFSFSSYHFLHLSHLDLMSIQWLPFSVLFLLRTSHEGTWRDRVICAACLAATALTAFYYLLFLLVFTAVLVGYLILSKGSEGWLGVQPRVAGVYIIFALLVLPILAPILIAGRTQGRVATPRDDVDRYRQTFWHSLCHRSPIPCGVMPFRQSTTISRTESRDEAVAFLGFIRSCSRSSD